MQGAAFFFKKETFYNFDRYSYCKLKLTPALRMCLRKAGIPPNLNLIITKEDRLKLQAYIV